MLGESTGSLLTFGCRATHNVQQTPRNAQRTTDNMRVSRRIRVTFTPLGVDPTTGAGWRTKRPLRLQALLAQAAYEAREQLKRKHSFAAA